MVNLFIILPESEPSTPWTLPNGDFQNEDGIVTFIQSLKNKLDTISLESFNGYYDNLNIINFLRDFEDLADYYPNPSFRRLRFILKDWDNWRDEINQDNDKEYIIFSQAIEGHTFCEIAERQLTIGNNKFSILNHFGHSLGNEINVVVNNDSLVIPSASSEQELVHWFALERIPSRDFQIIEKHGENREEVIRWSGEDASPLRCSKQKAYELLKFAIGDSIDELFNYDVVNGQEYFIVFKFEGNTPQNMYHGYHVPLETTEIPPRIKDKLLERNNDS